MREEEEGEEEDEWMEILPPDLETSNPDPAPPDFSPGPGSRSWARRRASLPLRRPRWYSVALFFLRRSVSSAS